jgi:uncharacterized membrane protein
MDEENKIYDFEPDDIEQNKVISGLAYIIFFLPLLVCPKSKFGKFHSNQSLLLLIVGLIGNVIITILSSFIAIYSVLFSLFLGFISLAFGITIFVLFIIGLINAFNGRAKELPIIGSFRILKY